MRCHAPRKIFGGILEGNLKGAKSLGVLCEQLLVLIKMYRLRSGKSSSTPANTRPSNENSSSPELRQSTILFRKRRHPYAEAAAEDKLKTSTENLADHYSPPKRSKTAGKHCNTYKFPFLFFWLRATATLLCVHMITEKYYL